MQAQTLPTTGGSYTRDSVTGELLRVPDDAPAAPETPIPEPDEPVSPKPKGGK